jgi:hypothetical protein
MVWKRAVSGGGVMAQPFIYIGTYTIKDGRLEDFKRMCEGIVELVDSNEPRVISFNFYYDEASNEVSCVQVHPDADSMVNHMNLLQEHFAAATGTDSPIDAVTTNQIYGAPNDTVVEMIEEWDPGVPMPIKAMSLGGLTRSTAA